MRQVLLKKLLISVCFMISMSSIAQTFSVDGIEYKIWDAPGTVRVVDGSNCKGDITIPETVSYLNKNYVVTKIGSKAFMGSSLTSIHIPNTVTTIEHGAFSFCRELTKVNMPNSVNSIGYEAFAICPITSIVIPDSVKVIEKGTFKNCNRLESVTIPNSVTMIGNGAFRSCESLTSIAIPNSVTMIGDEAFSMCSSLSSVKMSNSVTVIGNGLFYLCNRLASFDMPNMVTTIGDEAFYFCQSLPSITIPSTVKSIGKDAFSYCGAKEIYSKMTNPMVCDCFNYANYTYATLYVPKNTKFLYESLESWKNFQKIEELDYEATGIENVYKDDIKVAVNGGNLEVEGAKGEMVEVYSMDGKKIYCGKSSSIPVGKGTYIVRVANHSFKVSR